jgi:hypothetical protein
VVVFLGLLVALYSTGYLTRGNKEHPHDGSNRYYAFLLIFIGAMSGLVLSSTLLGQLLFFEITGGCSGAHQLLPVREIPTLGDESAADHPRRFAGLVSGGGHAVSANRHLRAERLKPVKRQRRLNRLRWDFVCCLGNRRNCRCRPGYRMRWKRRRQSVHTCTPRRW